MSLIDRLITKIDRIRERVNVDKVGVRRYRLYRVIRTWSGGEVEDGSSSISSQEIEPAPAITLGRTRDALTGRGRVEKGTMTATEVSLSYSESDLMPALTAGQELYYRLVDLHAEQGAATSYWHLASKPEADRCETVAGNIQWIMNFVRAEISE